MQQRTEFASTVRRRVRAYDAVGALLVRGFSRGDAVVVHGERGETAPVVREGVAPHSVFTKLTGVSG